MQSIINDKSSAPLFKFSSIFKMSYKVDLTCLENKLETVQISERPEK